MALIPLPRALDGSIILPGRIRHELSTNFGFDSAPPAAIPVTVDGTGSVTYSPFSVGRGEVTLTTGTTANNGIHFTFPGINLDTVESVTLRVEGIRTGPDLPARFVAAIASKSDVAGNTGVGVMAQKQPNNSWFYLRRPSNDTSEAITVPEVSGIRSFVANARLDMTLILLPRLKQAHILQGDQVATSRELTGFISGTVSPYVRIETNSTTPAVLSLSKLTLSVTAD